MAAFAVDYGVDAVERVRRYKFLVGPSLPQDYKARVEISFRARRFTLRDPTPYDDGHHTRYDRAHHFRLGIR